MIAVTVHVKLYAQLRKYHPGPNRSKEITLQLPDGAVAGDLIAALRLPLTLVKTPFINEQKATLETALQDGDRISLFSPVVGGV